MDRWSLETAVFILTFIPFIAGMLSSNLENAGVSFSLKVRLMVLGAATVALAAGVDVTRWAWAAAEPAMSIAVLAARLANVRYLRIIEFPLFKISPCRAYATAPTIPSPTATGPAGKGARST